MKTFRRILSVLLIAALLAALTPVLAAPIPSDTPVSHVVEQGGVIYQVFNGQYAEILDLAVGCPADLIIPETVDGVPVEVVREWAFTSETLRSVILPDTVTTIYAWAFNGCPNLVYVGLPDSVTHMAESALDATEQLRVLYLPANLEDPPKEIVYWSRYMLFAVTADSAAEQYVSKNEYSYVRLYEDRDYVITATGVYEIVDGEAILLGLAGTGEGYVVPDTVGEYPVTTISEDAVFVWRSQSCNTLYLGENVTTIERTALLNTGISVLYTTANLISLPKPLFNGKGEIFGEKGSYAEQYAAKNDIKFTVIGSIPFKDVPENAWYYDALKFCYKNNLMAGVSETSFKPLDKTTRAMLVTVLWRLCGEEYFYGECPYFTDVADYQWYSDAISWAAYYGVVYGTSETKFSPNDPLTREQLAAILFRFAEMVGGDVSKFAPLGEFKDANKVSSWAKTAMMWAVEAGIISGTDKGELNPLGHATRAEVASILMRFIAWMG